MQVKVWKGIHPAFIVRKLMTNCIEAALMRNLDGFYWLGLVHNTLIAIVYSESEKSLN